MCHVCLVYAGLKCVCRILCWNRSCLIRLWVHPVLSSHPGREGIERGHDYSGIRLQSVCAFACACAFWTQMLSVLPLGEMGQLKVIAVCMSVCMSLCQTWVCPSTTGGVCLGLNWICWRLLSFHFNISFLSLRIMNFVWANVKVYSSLCFFCFAFDEEMFFDEVVLGVPFDVCFQYASCDSEVIICYTPTRQWKVHCVIVVCKCMCFSFFV